MDKKSYTGLIIIFLILIGFYWLNKPSEDEVKRWQAYHDSLARVEALRQDSIRQAEAARLQSQIVENESDSAAVAARNSKYGLLADAVEGNEEFVTLENNLVIIKISTKGARVYSAELKDYKAFGDKPLRLFDGDKNEFGFEFTHNNRTFYTNDLFFRSQGSESIGDTVTTVSFSVTIGDGNLTYKYSLPDDSYALDLAIESQNLAEKVSVNGAALDLKWITDMPALEKSHKSEGIWSSLYYKYDGGDVEELGTTDNQHETVNMSLDWVALKDQYFSTVLVAKNGFAGAELRSKAFQPSDTIIKHADVSVGVKFDFYDNDRAEFQMLFIPNYFYTLDSFEGLELTELLPLGWGIFGWINEYVIIPVFKLLEGAFDNYGIIILLLTILIKLVLFPFVFTSFKSQAKMRVLKPQIDEINAKIPADKPMERQQATMNLYKRAGVSPMGGCLPLLIQMPILFAAFRFFPAAVELRGKSFLWADDLSTYDSILDLPFSIPFYGDHVSLFCLLMCVLNLVYTRFNMQSQSTAQMPGMSAMMYIMPVMLLFFFNDYPAGLCYYYFISTLITVLQTLLIKAFFIDEQAILAKIEANKKRPHDPKKSKWAQRYEELMRQQTRQQQQKRK